MFCSKCGKEIKEHARFCDGCGASVQNEGTGESQPNQAMMQGNGAEETKTAKKKSFFKCIAGFMIVLAVIIAGYFFVTNGVGENDKFVSMVKTGHPTSYPDITYGEAFGEFFAKPKWRHFTGEKGQEVVEFNGDCTYSDANVTMLFQFIVEEDEDTFSIEYFDMNGVPQETYKLYVVLEKVFEEYEDNHQSSGSEKAEKKNELSQYLGMEEDEMLEATGYEKNEYETYPDMEHGAIICVEGIVNTVVLNKENNKDFMLCGKSGKTKLSDWDDIVSNLEEYDVSEVQDGTRAVYIDQENNRMFMLEYDENQNVIAASYTVVDEDMQEGMNSEGDFEDSDVMGDGYSAPDGAMTSDEPDYVWNEISAWQGDWWDSLGRYEIDIQESDLHPEEWSFDAVLTAYQHDYQVAVTFCLGEDSAYATGYIGSESAVYLERTQSGEIIVTQECALYDDYGEQVFFDNTYRKEW